MPVNADGDFWLVVATSFFWGVVANENLYVVGGGGGNLRHFRFFKSSVGGSKNNDIFFPFLCFFLLWKQKRKQKNLPFARFRLSCLPPPLPTHPNPKSIATLRWV